MKWFLSQIRREEGQSLVIVALSVTVLMGFLALATDVGVALRQRRMAQRAADSAALAGAFESLYESTPSTVSNGMWTAASNDATLNGFTPGASNGTANATSGVTLTIAVNPNITIPGYNAGGNVQATVRMPTTSTFLGMFGFGGMNVSTTAIASNTITADGCMNVQNGGNYANPSVSMGGSSVVFGQHCGVTINGNANLSGNADINARFVAASGAITLSGSGSITGPESQNTGAPTPDPFFKLQEAANQPTVNTTAKTCAAPAGSGMSCVYNYQNGSLSGALTGNTIYVFDNNVTTKCGQGNKAIPCVLINNSVSVTPGTGGITLYLSPNMPLDYYSNGAAILSPPTAVGGCVGSSNPLCGILIDAPTDGSNGAGTYDCNTGKGNNGGNPGELYFDFGSSTTVLNGVVYAPYMQMFVQDQGASTTLNADLTIGNFCSQAATLTVNEYSGPQSPLTKVGLVY